MLELIFHPPQGTRQLHSQFTNAKISRNDQVDDLAPKDQQTKYCSFLDISDDGDRQVLEAASNSAQDNSEGIDASRNLGAMEWRESERLRRNFRT